MEWRDRVEIASASFFPSGCARAGQLELCCSPSARLPSGTPAPGLALGLLCLGLPKTQLFLCPTQRMLEILHSHCSLHHSSGPSPGASHSHFSLHTSTCLNSHSRTVFLSHPHTVSCDLAVLEPEGREGTVFYPISLSLTKASER